MGVMDLVILLIQEEPGKEAQRENLENPQELCMLAVVVVAVAAELLILAAEKAALGVAVMGESLVVLL